MAAERHDHRTQSRKEAAPNPTRVQPSRRAKALRAHLPKETAGRKGTAAKIQSPIPLQPSPSSVRGVTQSQHPKQVKRAVTKDPKLVRWILYLG